MTVFVSMTVAMACILLSWICGFVLVCFRVVDVVFIVVVVVVVIVVIIGSCFYCCADLINVQQDRSLLLLLLLPMWPPGYIWRPMWFLGSERSVRSRVVMLRTAEDFSTQWKSDADETVDIKSAGQRTITADRATCDLVKLQCTRPSCRWTLTAKCSTSHIEAESAGVRTSIRFAKLYLWQSYCEEKRQDLQRPRLCKAWSTYK